jgi:hypothetical protein
VLRQHGDTVFLAFAVAHNDLLRQNQGLSLAGEGIPSGATQYHTGAWP